MRALPFFVKALRDLVILQKTVAGLSEDSLGRFVLRARKLAGLHGAANVQVTTSNAVQALNRRFRNKNKATDVLSFPAVEPAIRDKKTAPLAGDIVISADIAAQNAVKLGHSAAEEVKILTLHGILHLAGFDHERDNGEMARRESELRQKLGLPVALIERASIESPRVKPPAKLKSVKSKRSSPNRARVSKS
jgi:probable rRNA maturation factor